VCISWDQWRLPASDADLPVHFLDLSIDEPPPGLPNGGYMDDIKGRDDSCRLSAIFDGCDQAHLVPAIEREWWAFNMGTSGIQIESALNGILLRSDLHRSFDAGTWVPMAIESRRLVAYVVRGDNVSNQFAELWHCTEMQTLVGVDRRCLFARVAWAVLSLLHEFLATWGLARENLLVRMKDGEQKEVAPEVFQQLWRSRSKNPSPTKRPRLRAFEENDGVIIDAQLFSDDETDDDDSEASSDKNEGRKDEPRLSLKPDQYYILIEILIGIKYILVTQ